MEEFSMPQSILQIVSEKGFDGLREIMLYSPTQFAHGERNGLRKSQLP